MNPKNLFCGLFLYFFTLILGFSQDSTNTRKNEFGLESWGFITSILGSGASPFNYLEDYIFSYRRYFKSFNLRAGLRGNLNSDQRYEDDSLSFSTSGYSIGVRAGIEKTEKLSKRWNFYYGGDLRFDNSSGNTLGMWNNGGWARDMFSKTNTFGVAPVAGIRFSVSSRISFTTETAFIISWVRGQSLTTHRPSVPSPPEPRPEDEDRKSNTVRTQFAPPFNLFICISL